MIRNQCREWALCPHCRIHAEQTFLLAVDRTSGVRWSTCGRCGQSAIWDGPVAVFPALERRAV